MTTPLFAPGGPVNNTALNTNPDPHAPTAACAGGTMSEFTAHGLERAWLLARHHFHHWAGDAAFVPFLKTLPEAYQCRVGENVRDLFSGLPHYEEFMKLLNEQESLSPDGTLTEGRKPVPPKTEEEATVLSWFPSSTGSYLYWKKDEDGVHRRTTGSGRLSWEVTPNGDVTLIVERPPLEGEEDPRVVLMAKIKAMSKEVNLSVLMPDHIADRHCDSLIGALKSLDVEVEPVISALRPYFVEHALSDFEF